MNIKKTYFITGASGFVGAALAERLVTETECEVRALIRRDDVHLPASVVPVRAKENYLTEGEVQLAGVDVLVHCAARVHVMSDVSCDPLTEYRKINVSGTLRLAKHAAASGVQRFIFISSIKVNGEFTLAGNPFTADDIPNPCDPYGVSKLEAEQQLILLAEQTGMEVVIIRPVLVYGRGVKANFRSMMGWLDKGIPLPLGAVRNQRSLVCLDNLIDLIVTCSTHPSAANQTFLASDGDDMSTTNLLKRMGNALGKPARLFRVPPMLLVIGGTLLGRKNVVQRLCGSLQVDIEKNKHVLGWTPPFTVESALRQAAVSYQAGLK